MYLFPKKKEKALYWKWEINDCEDFPLIAVSALLYLLVCSTAVLKSMYRYSSLQHKTTIKEIKELTPVQT